LTAINSDSLESLTLDFSEIFLNRFYRPFFDTSKEDFFEKGWVYNLRHLRIRERGLSNEDALEIIQKLERLRELELYDTALTLEGYTAIVAAIEKHPSLCSFQKTIQGPRTFDFTDLDVNCKIICSTRQFDLAYQNASTALLPPLFAKIGATGVRQGGIGPTVVFLLLRDKLQRDLGFG
jgi:hypothetical protein